MWPFETHSKPKPKRVISLYNYEPKLDITPREAAQIAVNAMGAMWGYPFPVDGAMYADDPGVSRHFVKVGERLEK